MVRNRAVALKMHVGFFRSLRKVVPIKWQRVLVSSYSKSRTQEESLTMGPALFLGLVSLLYLLCLQMDLMFFHGLLEKVGFGCHEGLFHFL